MDMVHLVSVYIMGFHIVYKPLFISKFKYQIYWQVFQILTNPVFITYLLYGAEYRLRS
jgi:hypothetical protein